MDIPQPETDKVETQNQVQEISVDDEASPSAPQPTEPYDQKPSNDSVPLEAIATPAEAIAQVEKPIANVEQLEAQVPTSDANLVTENQPSELKAESLKDRQASQDQPIDAEKSNDDATVQQPQNDIAVTQIANQQEITENGQQSPQQDTKMDAEENNAEAEDKQDEEVEKRTQQSYGGKGLFVNQPISAPKNQLITIQLDMYQAARLNSILSQISLNSDKTFRIDGFEKVEGDLKRKEALEKKESAKILREEKRIKQQKEREAEKLKQREQNRAQMDLYNLKFKNAQKQHMTNAMRLKPEDSAQNVQQLVTAQANQMNGDESKMQQSQAIGTPSKSFNGIGEDGVGLKGDDLEAPQNDPENAGEEGISYKPNAEMKLDNMGNPAEGDAFMKDENYARGLSPITRRSDRARADISYSALNTSGKPTTDELDLQPLAQGISVSQVQQSKDQPKLKSKNASMVESHNSGKKTNTSDTQKKIEDMLERLKRSQHAHLFNQPIGKDEPLYENFKNNNKTLSFIELNLKMGQYTNTGQIGQDIRQIVAIRMQIAMSSGDQDKNLQIQDFLGEFDQSFNGLDNLPLGKSADHTPNPNPGKKGSNNQVSKPNGGRSNGTAGQSVQNQKPKPTNPKPSGSQQTQGGMPSMPAMVGQPPVSGAIVIETQEPSMTQEEIQQLKMKIDTQLTPEQKKGVLPIIKEEALLQQQEHQARGVQQANGSTTFEFQLDKLSIKTARLLESFVNQQVATNKKKQKRKETDALRRKKAQVVKQEQQRQRDALAAQQKAREGQINPQAYNANATAAKQMIIQQQNPIAGVPLVQNQAQAFQQLYPGLSPQQIQGLLAAQNQKGQASNPQIQQQLAAVGANLGNPQGIAQQQALMQILQANAAAQNLQQANIQKQADTTNKNQYNSQSKQKGDNEFDSDSSSSSDE